MPLKTAPLDGAGHLLNRDSNGIQVDYLPSSGRSDMLLDFQIPVMFLKSGMWTFKVDARLGDKRQFMSICHVVDTMVRRAALRSREFRMICRLNLLIV